MHSCVYVIIGPTGDITDRVAKAMHRFKEDLPVSPYKIHHSASFVAAMAAQYQIPRTDLKALAAKMPDWMNCPGGVDDLGLFSISTSNPDGQWDWYEIGGRWDGLIAGRSRPKDGATRCNCMLASTLVRARDFRKRLPFAVITPTGEWIKRSGFVTNSSGWYTTEQPDDDWCEHVRSILKAFPRHRVVCVDVHN